MEVKPGLVCKTLILTQAQAAIIILGKKRSEHSQPTKSNSGTQVVQFVDAETKQGLWIREHTLKEGIPIGSKLFLEYLFSRLKGHDLSCGGWTSRLETTVPLTRQCHKAKLTIFV